MIRPERVARVDLGAVSDEDAERVLELAKSCIAIEIRALGPIERHLDGLEHEDLVSIGQIAAIEAFATWEAGRGARLKTWIQRMVRWRLRETVQSSQRQEEPEEPQVLEASVSNALVDSVHTILIADRICSAFARAYRELSPREQELVEHAVVGRTRADAARMLQARYSDVCRETNEALARIRDQCAPAAGKIPA